MSTRDNSVHPSIPTLLITGPVGVGKTTVAAAISDDLTERDIPNGLIDLDALRWAHPRPAGDPFHGALGLRNLAAVAANYRAAGVTSLLLVDVLESREQLAHYYNVIPGAVIQVVRLTAAPATMAGRITKREHGAAGHDWHQQRAVELTAIFAREQPEDILIDTDGKSPQVIATEILARAGWPVTER